MIALIFVGPTDVRTGEFQPWLAGFIRSAAEIPGVEYVQQFAAREQFLVFPPPPAPHVVLIEFDGDATDSRAAAQRLAELLMTANDHLDPEKLGASLLEEFRAEMRVAGLPDDLRQRHPRDLLVFFLGPVTGRETEYHDWYDRAHIRNGLTLDGFVTGQRFHAGPAIIDTPLAPSEFAAIYEVYGSDLDTAIEAAKNSAGKHEQSSAADAANMRAYALSSVGPVVRPGKPVAS